MAAMYPIEMHNIETMTSGLRKPDKLDALTTVAIDFSATRNPTKHKLRGVRFLPDTGANITGIPKTIMSEMGIREHELGYRTGIQSPKTADGESRLRPIGIMRGTLDFRGRSMEMDVYVMENLAQPILSRSACIGLGIFSSKLDSFQQQ